MWGDAPAEVADYLRQSGLDRWVVDEQMKALQHERSAAVREAGWWKLGKGLLLLAGGGGAFWLTWGPRVGRGAGVFLAVAAYGLYLSVGGLDWVITGRMKGAIAHASSD